MSYAAFKTKNGEIKTLKLPILIGPHQSYDFSCGGRDHTICIFKWQNELTIMIKEDLTVLTDTDLKKRTGLVLLGEIKGESFTFSDHLALIERKLAQKFPLKMQKYFDDQYKKMRYGILALTVGLGAMIIGSFTLNSQQNEKIDKSSEVINLGFGLSSDQTYGNLKSNPVIHNQVLLHFSADDSKLETPIILQFRLWGQTYAGRTSVSINDQIVWKNSDKNSECVTTGCDESVLLQPGHLPKKPWQIVIKNHDLSQPWLIARIKASPREDLDEISLNRIKKLISDAKYNLSQQSISTANIFRSKDQIEKARELLGQKGLSHEIQVDLNSLEEETNQAINQYQIGVLFRIEQAIRTEQFHEAELVLVEAQSYFKDQASQIYSDLLNYQERLSKFR